MASGFIELTGRRDHFVKKPTRHYPDRKPRRVCLSISSRRPDVHHRRPRL